MANDLIVNVTADETRVAFLENGVVSELLIERVSEVGIVGNIYKGKVQRVLPGMNAAFVEVGVDKATFLYATDFSEEIKEVEDDEEEDLDDPTDSDKEESSENEPSEDSEDEEDRPELRRSYRWAGRQGIHKLLKAGQEILVQVTRDSISTKGARVTSHISLPGRYLVYMPTWGKLGVSKKVGSFEERRRLRQILRKLRPAQGGFIVRTAAEGVSEEQLQQDVNYLTRRWQDILRRKESAPAPSLIQTELDVVHRALRDLYGAKIDRVVIDDPEEYERVREFTENFMPELAEAIELYPDVEPIFDRYGIESEINRALGKKIWLKSGGYLIIEQTEALTTIDVNTGRFTGKKNLEETILKTNLEAVDEIAYQLKLRNLGGIVILDLIDMERRSSRDKVQNALADALKTDRARTTITKISELGLIEMTRKRSRESLTRTLCESCPYCEGKSYVKSALTMVYEIFRELKREAPFLADKKVYLSVHPQVFNLLHHEERKNLEKIEKKLGKKIEIKSQENTHLEQFHISLE